MADTVFTYKAMLDASNVLRNLKLIQQEFIATGRRGRSDQIGQAAAQFKAYSIAVKQAQQQLVKLQALQKQFADKPGLTRVKGITDAQSRRAIQAQQGPLGQGKNATESQVNAAVKATEQSLDSLTGKTNQYREALVLLSQSATQSWSKVRTETDAALAVLSKAEALTGGGTKKDLQLGLAKGLDAEIAKVQEQIQQLNSAAAKQGTGKQLAAYRRIPNYIAEANKQRARALQLTKEIAAIEEKIAGSTGENRAARDEIKRLTDLRAEAQKREAAARDQARRPEQQQETRTRQAGTAGVLQELEQNLQRLQQLRDDVFDPAVIEKQHPALAKQIKSVDEIRAAYKKAGEGTEEQATRLKQLQQETQKLEKMTQEAIAGKGIKPGQGALNPEEMTRNLAKMRPGIDRLFEGIFSDMSRRFVATLQFTVSAAIIFGAQRLAKEFIQAAIEVERAFQDISTALEYDVDAERGTLAFERQVEQVRIQVLGLANEFNILPSEANEAAYVMVSRFNNVTNAMKALKAQLLATKVSGIEQGEVLRALTATAEGFAAAVFTVNDGLSLQAKLQQRETVAAGLYGKALDLAVQIQQKYGVETEDTLEGTARATEVFRQMGFTMEETAAIVAGTSRQLGQTGQQVAERLNRSLGQLTDPKIRESLLDLAAANESFNLSIGDFGSGAQAWEKIVDQYERLEQSDPQVARQILQIVGQRRELEAVAAALGTADLQKDIIRGADESAGAAEKRFDSLSRTMDEIMKSIAAQFQSLAQSFQTLGGLSSIKILLVALESILTVLGRILDMVKWVIDGIDEFLGIPIASQATQWLLVGASIATVLRMVLALKRAYIDLASFGAISSIANFVGTGLPATLAAAKAGGLRQLIAGGRQGSVIGRSVAGLAPGVAGPIAPASGGVLAALATPAGAFAAAAAGAVLLGLAFKSTADRAKALESSLQDGSKSMTDAAVAAQRQAIAEDLSADATERLILLKTLEAAQLAASVAPSGRPGVADIGLAIWKDITPAGWTQRGDSFESTRIFSEILNPENVGGSQEQWVNRAQKIQSDLLQSQVNEMRDVNRSVWEEIDYSNLTADEKDDVRRTQQGIAAALDEAARKRLAAQQPGVNQDERSLLLAQADDAAAKAQFAIDRLFGTYGTLAQSTIDSVNRLKQQLGAIDTDIALGLTTEDRAATFARSAAQQLLEASEYYKTIGDDDSSADALALSRDAELQAMNLEKSALDKRITAVKVWHDGRAAIRAELEQVTAFYRTLAIDDPRWGPTLQRMLQLQMDLHDANLDATRAQYQHAVDMARNFEESIAARKELYHQIIRQISQTRDDDAKDELRREADKLEQDIIRDEYDNRTKVLQAQKRLSGPIFSRALAIQAEVIGQQRIINSQFASYAEKLEAQVRLKELFAQQQQNELARLKALKLSTISVRDSMSRQLVELSGLRRASELAAEQYGTASQEYAESLIAIQEMEKAIIDATLELESVNRQLSPDFDVTDPLHAAEENYVKAARALQIPDLGEAEKAAAELEAKNAEAALVQAQYNDKLFDLRFQHESGKLGTSAYIAALQGMLATVDTTTHQGKQLWIQINSLIEGLTSDIAGQAFNIPGQIRIPTLFEVRRAVQAEALGVNYMDNRQQDINVYVSDNVQLDALMETIAGVFDVEQARFAPGGAGITLGI